MRRLRRFVPALLLLSALAGPAPSVRAAVAAAPHHVRLRGITLYYEVEGQGPPLLLLHGGAGNGMQFEKQRPEFARSHRLIVPDSRAQGRSTDHPDRIVHLVTFGANTSPDGLQPADRAWNASATADSFGTGMEQGWKALNPEPSHYSEAMEKILTLWRTLPRFTPAELGSIRARTLICAGEHDLILPEHTALLAATIPHA